jgi:hypothetical protein
LVVVVARMAAAEDDDCCAVCLEALVPSATTATMPGCGHRFHTACLLTCAQYDVRCPVCRRVGEGVQPREDKAREDASVTIRVVRVWGDDEEGGEGEAGEAERERVWRRYAARRRRVLRRHPELAERFARLRELRRDMERVQAEAHRAHRRRCLEAWRADAEVVGLRREFARLRRRERRLEGSLEADLEVHLGPEPSDE